MDLTLNIDAHTLRAIVAFLSTALVLCVLLRGVRS